MVELHHIYTILYASGAVLSFVVAFAAWRRRVAWGARSLVVLMLGVALWSVASAAQWYVGSEEQQIFWIRATSLGVWMVPVGFLALALDIAGTRRWLSPARIALISIASFTLANLEWLNPDHLYDAGFVATAIGPYTAYDPVPGPLYWAFVVFGYGSVLIGLVIILRVYLRSSGTERTQPALLLLGGLIPLAASAVTESRLLPLYGLDLAPLAFLVTGTLWLSAVLRGAMLDVLPVARDALFEQMSEGVAVLDAEGHVVDANSAAMKMLHARRAEVLGRPAGSLLRRVNGAAALLDGSGQRRAVLPIGSDGDSLFVEMEVTPLFVRPGGPPAQLLTLHDVTEERRANERLELARQVFDTADEGIVVTLPGGGMEIVDVNDAFCRMTGRLREDTIGKAIGDVQSDRHPPEFYTAMQRQLLAEGEWKGEVWQARADGSAFPSWLTLAVTKDGQEHPKYLVGVFADMTEIRAAEDKLRYNATHDALTGLPNRLLLEDRLEHALARRKRKDRELAVLFVGVDNFESVNDTLGHSRGDDLLVQVAERIVSVTRESDTVGRYGGGEFMIIIVDGHDLAHVRAAARRVFESMAMPFRVGAEAIHLTVSAGVALSPTDAVDAGGLVQRAHIAMLSAKELGSGRVQFFSEEIQETLDRRMAVERELWGADEEGRYFLLYQPQVDLATGGITGVEALVRLRARDGGVLSPAEFIPVAEDTELILRLGDWVLHEACARLGALREIAPDLVMSVNFSARQFKEIDVTALRDELRSAGVEAGSLALEITETAFLVDPRESADKLNELRDVTGIQLALDDFGTGYSSLTYVRMFRAGTIKIDRSFVELLPDDAEARAIVLSILGMAKGLGATVVAEGPETEEQVRFLRANGCDTAQGFYFSRPIPADELMVLLGGEPFELPEVSPAGPRGASAISAIGTARAGSSGSLHRDG